MSKKGIVGFAAVAIGAAALMLVVLLPAGTRVGPEAGSNVVTKPGHWAAETQRGPARLHGQVPLAVNGGTARYVAPHPQGATIHLNFGFPLRDRAGLDRLIAQQARTHRYLTRAQLYARFAPPPAQVRALTSWLTANGFTVTHVGLDRMAVGVTAPTSVVERVLHTRINDYLHAGYLFRGRVAVAPYRFYSNTNAAWIPARFGVQSISGLSDVDRFFTDAQLTGGPQGTSVRSGGYWPSDLRSMYDVHGFDGTGQTLGFTLWGAGERQAAMNTYAGTTGDQLITVDPACVAAGNSATTPSSCTTQSVAGDHLLSILEDGNTNNQFGANVETALDIEQAHGIATHAGMKYYLAACTSAPPAGSGLTNGSSCNGTDAGLEEAIEDAANDRTLHTVSNSWAFGGEAEWGNADPFLLASENSLAIAAAAGTTFYFSTGDSGTFQSGYPSDSRYVVGVGGTTLFSTSSTTTLSTEDTWAAGGSWCSNIEPRPSWQDVPAVQANAPCPGRVIPDISAVSDTSSSVRFTSSTNTTGGTSSGGVGGTSVAAPELNGMTAVLENFVAAQTYAGPAPQVGFVGPVLYQMGSSGHYDNYFRDVYCGNTANPTAGPDGDAAQPGWDPATGWGAPAWFNLATGYALTLGATNLSIPPSLSRHYKWTCARTPGNSGERGLAFPSKSTGYAVGTASGATPWYGKFLASGAWGAVNTFYKTTDGGKTWFPSNGDMISIACTSPSTCVEVGDGGRIKRTTDGGSTWSDAASPFNKGLTQVRCPSDSICYATGDRGTVLRSSDGGSTWVFLSSLDGNPLYGLACPTAAVCYATDIYAHVMKTSDGGTSWTMQRTPVTTPGLAVPGSGGPNPFAGLFGISCPTADTCVAVGGFPPAGTDPPIVTTTDGGNTWTLRTSNSGTGNYLHAVACLPATTQCWAVGRGGSIVTTTNLTTWTKVVSGTTNMLDSITCPTAAFCAASGQSGTIDVFNGSGWTAATGNGGGVFLAGVTCADASTCYAVGKQGVTITTTNGGTSWSQQAGGGTTQQMNAVSCSSNDACVAVGNAGTILQTSNGGQLWLARASGTTSSLNAVACPSTTACIAAGAAGTLRTSSDGGATWSAATGGTTQALNGVACSSATACVAVGAAGTIVATANAGGAWTAVTSGTSAALNAAACTSDECFASGVSGTILASDDAGATWAAQTSGTTQSLTGIACVNDDYCFAGGAVGTVVSTVDGGTTWTQQGNPLSGPTSALSAGAGTLANINAAACSSSRCFMGTNSSGNIMTTPLLRVSVNTKSPWGTTPSLSGLSPSDAAISYDASTEAGNVTGSLTCSTTADAKSPVDRYPVSGCSGLDDEGFNVVYDYDNSSHAVVKADQTIAFAPLTGKTWGDLDFVVAATASSGLDVAFAASGNCTLTAATVHITGAGSCTVTASQAGDDRYNAAPERRQAFAIAKATQTIAFTGPDPHTFGDSDFEIDPTASSGLPVAVAVTSGPCTLSVATAPASVHITGAGACAITASQAGDGNYLPADDQLRSFDVAKSNQTITFGTLADKTWGDADFALGASASSGLSVQYAADGNCAVSGSTVHIVSAGACTITATQAGDGNYNPAADVARSFAIHKADQTITFAALADKTFGDADFTVGATASSGLAVSFAVGASDNCTLSGTTVHITASGTCTVTAAQAGDGNYNAAPAVARTFAIANSTSGSVRGQGLKPATGGEASFRFDAATLTGELVYKGPHPKKVKGKGKTPALHVEAETVTSLGIAADGNSAWIQGKDSSGRTFLVYVEDNTDSKKPRNTTDVFKLWIDGVLQTGSGALDRGKVTIK